MKLNRTDNPINREGRNKLNENWETLERTYKKVVDDSAEALSAANQAVEKSDNAINIATEKGDEAIGIATAKGNEAVNIATQKGDASINIAIQKGDASINIATQKGNEAIEIANQANNTSNYVQQQLDTVILESGDSSAEVVQARSDFVNLRDRLDTEFGQVTTQLAQTTEHMLTIKPKVYGNRFADTLRSVNSKERKAIVSFVSDDLYMEDWDKREWFKSLGAPYTIAVVTDYINANNKPTDEQLRILQDEYGYEIGSHTVTHPDLTTLTNEEIESELIESKRILESYGLKCNNLFIPFGNYNDNVLKIAAKHYRSVRISEEGANPVPIDSLKLNTIWIDRWGSGTLEFYKSKVDAAIQNKIWLIFSMHTGQMQESEFTDMVKPLIEYIHSAGVEIMTVDKALDIYGNLVELANFTGPIANRNLFTIDCDGNIRTKDDNVYMKVINALNTPVDHTPLELDRGIVRSSIETVNAAGYPENTAGVLTAYKIGGRDFWFETYQVYRSNRIYTRWAIDNDTWTAWVSNTQEPITVSVKPSDFIGTQITNNTPPTSFPIGQVIYNAITPPYISGFPGGAEGILVTHRIISGLMYIYQEYHVYDQIYKRYATSETTWSTWKKVTAT